MDFTYEGDLFFGGLTYESIYWEGYFFGIYYTAVAPTGRVFFIPTYRHRLSDNL